MYNLYLKNFQTMNEYYIGYLENMKKIMESSAEASRKMNEESSGELCKGNQNVTNLCIIHGVLSEMNRCILASVSYGC
jgi:hypothetical protein